MVGQIHINKPWNQPTRQLIPAPIIQHVKICLPPNQPAPVLTTTPQTPFHLQHCQVAITLLKSEEKLPRRQKFPRICVNLPPLVLPFPLVVGNLRVPAARVPDVDADMIDRALEHAEHQVFLVRFPGAPRRRYPGAGTPPRVEDVAVRWVSCDGHEAQFSRGPTWWGGGNFWELGGVGSVNGMWCHYVEIWLGEFCNIRIKVAHIFLMSDGNKFGIFWLNKINASMLESFCQTKRFSPSDIRNTLIISEKTSHK